MTRQMSTVSSTSIERRCYLFSASLSKAPTLSKATNVMRTERKLADEWKGVQPSALAQKYIAVRKTAVIEQFDFRACILIEKKALVSYFPLNLQ